MMILNQDSSSNALFFWVYENLLFVAISY